MEPIETNFYRYFRSGCLIFLTAFSVQFVHAQAIIDPGGGEAAGPGGTASYSVGQIVYSFNAAAGGIENQGVQQPFEYVALPVRLVYFDAKVENEVVQVRWETAAEENNNFFTVEKSRNGVAFEQATIVNATGNSNSSKTYSWTDTSPYEGISYYRLMQTDFDNSFAYSTMKSVKIATSSGLAEIYPNPVAEFLFYKGGKSGFKQILPDIRSEWEVVETKKLSAGERKIDMTHLSPDLYLIQYNNDNEVQKFKIIKN